MAIATTGASTGQIGWHKLYDVHQTNIAYPAVGIVSSTKGDGFVQRVHNETKIALVGTGSATQTVHCAVWIYHETGRSSYAPIAMAYEFSGTIGDLFGAGGDFTTADRAVYSFTRTQANSDRYETHNATAIESTAQNKQLAVIKFDAEGGIPYIALKRGTATSVNAFYAGV